MPPPASEASSIAMAATSPTRFNGVVLQELLVGDIRSEVHESGKGEFSSTRLPDAPDTSLGLAGPAAKVPGCA